MPTKPSLALDLFERLKNHTGFADQVAAVRALVNLATVLSMAIPAACMGIRAAPARKNSVENRLREDISRSLAILCP